MFRADSDVLSDASWFVSDSDMYICGCGVQRSEHEAIEEDMKDKCFICRYRAQDTHTHTHRAKDREIQREREKRVFQGIDLWMSV